MELGRRYKVQSCPFAAALEASVAAVAWTVVLLVLTVAALSNRAITFLTVSRLKEVFFCHKFV